MLQRLHHSKKFHVTPSHMIEAVSLLCGNSLNEIFKQKYILLMHTILGNEVPVKTPMDFFEGSSRKVHLLEYDCKKKLIMRSAFSIIAHENASTGKPLVRYLNLVASQTRIQEDRLTYIQYTCNLKLEQQGEEPLLTTFFELQTIGDFYANAR